MKHTICLIDDKIPIKQYNEFFNETDIISGSEIKFMLNQEQTNWDEDPVVKKMCEELINSNEKWCVSAFTSPAFYSNYVEETVYSPEIVIYDWDYCFVAAGNESEEYLLDILRNSYTMIFIFSAQDNMGQIEQVLKKQEFRCYKQRLKVVNKNERNSVKKIVKEIEKKEKNNFTFAYGKKLILESNKAINKTLSKLSTLSTDGFYSSISSREENNNYIITTTDFVEAILPRYKMELNKAEWDKTTIKKKAVNIQEIKEVWAYRLYDNSTQSTYVKMGDIIKNNRGELFLVVSSDCHLEKFWKKNGGFISMVPLYKMNSKNGKKQQKMVFSNETKVTSLTNSTVSMTILPFVPTNDKKYQDYVLLPKAIKSSEIKNEGGQLKKPLEYSDLSGWSKVASILDPFKSPLIQFVMNNISGYGCPDFPVIMENYLEESIKKNRK